MYSALWVKWVRLAAKYSASSAHRWRGRSGEVRGWSSACSEKELAEHPVGQQREHAGNHQAGKHGNHGDTMRFHPLAPDVDHAERHREQHHDAEHMDQAESARAPG